MKLSIIVPCYNEQRVIEQFHKEIDRELSDLTLQLELIFVNDGSKDQTVEIIKYLSTQDHRVKFISFSRNFGKEAAMLAGLQYASGDSVVIMDADLQHPPYLIKQMLKGLDEGYDQIIAKRTREGDSPIRTLFTRAYYKSMNRFIDVSLVDGTGDFRLLSRKAVNALLSLSEYNRFSKGLFSWIGFKEKIIEYNNVQRVDGESNWTFPQLVNYGIDGVISFNNKPLRLSIYLGLLVTGFGLLYIVFSLIRILMIGVEEPGYFTLIASVLLFGGIQLIFLGIIGEYIGRIYYETKRRPHYVIDELHFERDHHEKYKND
jgi:glycosyltransferase involved in cell wall biosynthesis